MSVTDDDIAAFARRIRPHFEPLLQDIAEEFALLIARTAGGQVKRLRPETTLDEILSWLATDSLDHVEVMMSQDTRRTGGSGAHHHVPRAGAAAGARKTPASEMTDRAAVRAEAARHPAHAYRAVAAGAGIAEAGSGKLPSKGGQLGTGRSGGG